MNQIRVLLNKGLRDQRGLEMVEYMLIAALVVILLIGGWRIIGEKLQAKQLKLCNDIEKNACAQITPSES